VVAGQTDLDPFPGKVTWRALTKTGLDKPIIWALASYINTPGTLLAGSSGGGGYALTLIPPIHTGAKPTLKAVTPAAGKMLEVDYHGSWTGTQTIEFTYQWQDCTDGTCDDIAGETRPDFVIPAMGKKYRLKVIAQNDFPTGGQVVAYTDQTAVSGPKAGTFPGDNQSSTGSITPPGGTPQPGTLLMAEKWVFNPVATSTSFQWYRCNLQGASCIKIEGANLSFYMLTDKDVGTTLRVAVTGTNGSGSTTLGLTGQTNEVVAPSPKQISAPTLGGTAYVGHTLLSGVGTWAYAGTRFERRWQRCDADGSSCETLSDKTSTYVLKAADLGKRMRAEITVDSNIANKKPDATFVYTPLSDVVTIEPIVVDPEIGDGGGGGNGGNGGETPQPQPQPQPQPGDTAVPVLGSAGAVAAKLKPGKALSLKVNVSEAGTLSVTYQRVQAGRKSGKKCKAGGKKGKKCTIVTKVASFKVGVAAGSGTVALPKKKLAAGDYRAIVTPVDAAGNKGAPRTVKFKVTKK
jgi:hypothetical protein